MNESIEKAKAKAKGLVPTGTELKEAGELAGGIALGIIAVHAAGKFVKQLDTPVVHGAMLVGGFYGACKVKNTLLKSICAGASVYGGLRLAAKAVAIVTEPSAATTGGLTGAIAGALPDSVKDAVRKFIPTFAGIDEVSGLGSLGDSDNDFGDLGLDDQGNDEMGSYEDVSGLGATQSNAMLQMAA